MSFTVTDWDLVDDGEEWKGDGEKGGHQSEIFFFSIRILHLRKNIFLFYSFTFFSLIYFIMFMLIPLVIWRNNYQFFKSFTKSLRGGVVVGGVLIVIQMLLVVRRRSCVCVVVWGFRKKKDKNILFSFLEAPMWKWYECLLHTMII